MKILTTLVGIFLSFLLVGEVSACTYWNPRTLHVEWSYDTSVPGLAGYRIYQDGNLILEIGGPDILSADVYELCLYPGGNYFTMTAYDDNGNESEQSEPYEVIAPLWEKMTGLRIEPI